MEDLKSLREMVQIVKKRVGIIIFLTLLAVLISGVFTHFFVHPVYQTTTQVLVNRSDSEGANLNNENLQTDLQLINTYSDIMKSPVILGKVKEALGLKQSIGELSENISISNSSDSQVVNITVQASNAADAVRISNTTAETVITEIPLLMDVENISVLSPAVLAESQNPTSPNLFLNIALAGLVGLLIGISSAFMLEYLNTKIRDKQDVEKMLGIPVLGLIPIFENKELESHRMLPDKEA